MTIDIDEIRKKYPDRSVGEALRDYSVATLALSGVDDADETFLLMACFLAHPTDKTDGQLIQGIVDVLIYQKLDKLDKAWEVVDNILNSHKDKDEEGGDKDMLTERIF